MLVAVTRAVSPTIVECELTHLAREPIDLAKAGAEHAVMTRPGAPVRRREVESMANVLSAYRPLFAIQAPGTLDGGDVMAVGRKIYVGLSSRTSHEGIAQLDTHLSEWGYEVITVPVTGCLHLKSAVTQVADNLLLINDRWVSRECFGSMGMVTVAPGERDAADALLIGASVIYPTHHPATAERLERAGVRVVPVPCGELAKAEGGVTCCSVVFEAEPS